MSKIARSWTSSGLRAVDRKGMRFSLPPPLLRSSGVVGHRSADEPKGFRGLRLDFTDRGTDYKKIWNPSLRT